MSQEYLSEIVRMHNATSWVGGGVYQDPDNENMVIIKYGDNVVKMPKHLFESLVERTI